MRLIPAFAGDAEDMELSNLEEHYEEAKRGEEGRAGDLEGEPDPEQQRIEAQRKEAEQRKPDDSEPDAREGAATNPGGAGF